MVYSGPGEYIMVITNNYCYVLFQELSISTPRKVKNPDFKGEEVGGYRN